MSRLSLRLRSLLLAIIALSLFLPVTAYVLESAYTSSLTQAKVDELKLMNLALISEFELDPTGPAMPDLLYDEQLNLPQSGYVGVVIFRNEVVWQSASALNVALDTQLPVPPVGQSVFYEDFELATTPEHDYFLFAFTAEFASDNQFEPVHFIILNNTAAFSARRSQFLDTVWKGLAGLGALLLVLLSAGHFLILRPVRMLILEIQQASKGHQSGISAPYPKEFDGLKRSINHLISTESEQRARYKNSLGDLAHSLKTPLAVAMGTANLPPSARESMEQINLLVQRQLKRATAGSRGWQAPVRTDSVAKKIISSMQTIYRDKPLRISLSAQHDAAFNGDETDLFEILGNLLDNACKAAQQNVMLKIHRTGEILEIEVEDDGPGIDPLQQKHLLDRGIRLDTYGEGQGIGMAVVSDLVAIYGGQLAIGSGQWQGAKITLRFPIRPAG